ATCNKVFCSYQALGGHRASHKKIKGSVASKIDSSENSIDTETTPDQVPATDSNLHKIISDPVIIDHLMTQSDKNSETRKIKEHECSICL
ncbi:C2H2-type zinc finger protein, partial [Vibrio vulnificus]|nr:C2H2-type zinc finger protein [Vibrio vulnificus]